jgi:uncharacterized protein (DUF305 family)
MAGMIAAAVFTTVACSRSDTPAADTAQPAQVTPAVADTGMAAMPGMGTTPARDADQEFLRMMVDHHEGMIALTDTVLAKNPPADVRADAEKMKAKQKSEQEKMSSMLKSDFSEDKMPMVMASNTQMIADIASKNGADAGKAFRENTIKHHEEGIKMIDDFMARLTKPALKDMATKMKQDQTREIGELKAKLAKS